MSTIRILLADDHPIVRDGLRLLLERAPDLAVVCEAGDGPEALRLAVALRPDVLILDLALPELSGVEVARRLQADWSPVKILALSAHDDAAYVRGVLTHGAAGYLLKDEARQTIVDAVRGVARGERGWLSRQVAACLFQPEQAANQDAPVSLPVLTAREREVLRLVARGQNNEQIAGILGISSGTVRAHLVAIFPKLGVHRRSEAVAHAWAHQLVDEPSTGGNTNDEGHYAR